MRLIITLFCSLFIGILVSDTQAQIYCPDDKVVSCFSSFTTEECGNAIVISGNYNQSMVKYVDSTDLSPCNDGFIYRKFYVDINYDNECSSTEPYCIQTIESVYEELPLNLSFPSDITVSCIDDIPDSAPTWLYHPCDLVGYTYDDEQYSFVDGACEKIIRTFTVINWCSHDPITGEGIFTGKQVIKIIDEEAPIIESCAEQSFDVLANCEANVTLTNSAIDLGNCPSGELRWSVEIDLWADGTVDLVYGVNEPAPYKLNVVQNGDEISVVIPEPVQKGQHKILCKVTDGCSNVTTCNTKFYTVDNKPPTPYCYDFTSSALNGKDGGQLVLDAEMFVIDAIDNCSDREDIQISFSENVNDTQRVIECGDAGFQFFRIYYTDEAGNQDFCEIFMIIFDNGSCFGRYAPEGRISNIFDEPMANVEVQFLDGDNILDAQVSNEDGQFQFTEQGLFPTYVCEVSEPDLDPTKIDLNDFIRLQRGLLGLESFNTMQKSAADLNEDGKVNIEDARLFKDQLLGTELDPSIFTYTIYPEFGMEENMNANRQIQYDDYHQGFNFKAILKGDLVKAIDLNRTSSTLSFSVTIQEDRVVVRNKEAFKTDAILVDGISELWSEQLSFEQGKAYNFKMNQQFNSGEFQIELALEDLPELQENLQLASNDVEYTIQYELEGTATKDCEMSIYPLPATDYITISNFEGKFKIYSLDKKAYNPEITNTREGVQVKIQDLNPGVYFIVPQDESCGVRKFVKL